MAGAVSPAATEAQTRRERRGVRERNTSKEHRHGHTRCDDLKRQAKNTFVRMKIRQKCKSQGTSGSHNSAGKRPASETKEETK